MTDQAGGDRGVVGATEGVDMRGVADRHLKRLERALPLLADISLADVLILTPFVESGESSISFRTISHRRPINARTVYDEDRVGAVVSGHERPLLALAHETGEITDGGVYLEDQQRWIRTLAVPIRHDGEIIGMFAREFSPSIEEIPGDLQLTSFSILRRLAAMMAAGDYPYPVETRQHDHPPRVGDGLMLLDSLGVVEYASPNATTVLRTVGISKIAAGRRLSDLGISSRLVLSAHGQRLAFFDEYESDGKSMSLSCFPLIESSRVTGSLVLVRDITDLRSRDRLLLTKDATIAEIHHRVKNNLQTISSLLRLQSRRTESPDAQAAIEESVRRIRAIAIVHEILSHKSSDEVPFATVVAPLVQFVREALLAPGAKVIFEVDADDSILPSEMTTTLAIVVNELLQNCIDHAFPNGLGTADQESRVDVRIRTTGDELSVEIADTGVGLPTDFSLDSTGLGLTIVRTLVESELRGSLHHRTGQRVDPESGHKNGRAENIFAVRVPLHPGRAAR